MNIGAARRNTFGRKQIRQFRQGRVNARKYLAQQKRMISARSRRLQKKLETSFRKDLRIIISQVKAGVTPSFGASVARKEREIEATVRSETRKLFNTIVEINDEKYERVFTKQVDLGFGFSRPEAVARWTNEFIQNREIIFAGISQSMTRKILDDIQELDAEGIGVDALARQINRKYSGINRRRAALIARTETHNAAGYGQHNYHKSLSSDLGVSMVKQWVATLDARTRSSHAQMNGTQVSMDEPFMMPNGREMQYVGDPDGGAANVINCRCAIVYIDAEDNVEDEIQENRMDFSGKLPDRFATANNTLADYEDVMTNQVTQKQLRLQKRLATPTFATFFKNGKDKGFYSHYVGEGQVTTTARNRGGQTLTHEYGHHIDYRLIKDEVTDIGQRATAGRTWSEQSPKFKAAIRSDRNTNGLSGKTKQENILRWQNKLYERSASGRLELRKPEFGNYSDIIDALTRGDSFSDYGFWGHGRTYYGKRGMVPKEIFANLYSLRKTKYWPDVKKNLPELAQAFDDVIDEALDAAI